MQLKPITAIAVLLLVVASLLVAGCTTPNTSSSTTNPTTKPQTTLTPTATTEQQINQFYATKAVVVKPFVKTVIDNHTAYIGTVMPFENASLKQETRNMTIILCANRNDTLNMLHSEVQKVKSMGYAQYGGSQDDNLYFDGYIPGGSTTPGVMIFASTPNQGVTMSGIAPSYIPAPKVDSFAVYEDFTSER
jgi:hypothetical protein